MFKERTVTKIVPVALSHAIKKKKKKKKKTGIKKNNEVSAPVTLSEQQS